jgi:hypothetical protein
MPTICLKCGNISDTTTAKVVRCRECDFSIEKAQYDELIDFGRNVGLYGIRYRRRLESDLEEYGHLPLSYSLLQPSDIESWIMAVTVGGILGNAAYDGLKVCLKGLAKALIERPALIQRADEKRPFARPEDLDLIHTLLGADDEFYDEFTADIRDYINEMPNVSPQVKDAIISDERIQRQLRRAIEPLEIVAPSIKEQVVYVTSSGTKYHKRQCPQLRGRAKKIGLREAIEKYKPCKYCSPNTP